LLYCTCFKDYPSSEASFQQLYNAQIEKSLEDLQNFKCKLQSLSLANDEFKQRLTSRNEELLQKQQIIIDLERDRDQSIIHKQEIDQIAGNLRAELEKMCQRCAAVETEKCKVEMERCKVQEELGALKIHNESIGDAKSRLETENGVLAENVDTLRKNIEKLNLKCEQIGKMQNELVEARKKVDFTEKALEETRKCNETLETELDLTKNERNDIEKVRFFQNFIC